MGLETATYISDLVPANPGSNDNVSQGDNHLRLIKEVLQNTFPGLNTPFRRWRIEAVSANETATTADDGTIYLMDASGGARTVNLPAASTANILIGVKKVDTSANTVTIDPSGTELVDGATTLALRSQFDVVWVISNGTGWALVGQYLANTKAVMAPARARLATTTNVNLSSGLVSGASVDGVSLVTGDIVFVKEQTNATENGIYTVPASGAASRTPQYATADSLRGVIIGITYGFTYGGTIFNIFLDPGNLGSVDVEYAEVFSAWSFDSVEPDLSRDDFLLGVNGATGATVLVDVGDLPGTRRLHVQDQRSSGTDGGNGSAGANTRVLNAVVHNSISGASLGSNRVTLPSGTYDVDCSTPISTGGLNSNTRGKLYLYNVTDGAVQMIGSSGYLEFGSQGGIYNTTTLHLRGRMTITASKVFEVRCYMGGNNRGFGEAGSAGMNEVYTDIIFSKVE